MDFADELRKERSTLVQADRDLIEGNRRMVRQQAIVLRMRNGSYDASEAEHLAELLGETLHQWQRHRELIVHRIAYLEGKLAIAARPT